METVTRPAVVWFTPEQQPALLCFWSIYEAHLAEITAGTLQLVSDHPEFGPLIRAMPEEQRLAQNARSREQMRRAIEDGAWQAYEDDLRVQGAIYAQMGISFAGWYDLVRLFQQYMVPLLVAAYGPTPDTLVATINVMQRFLDRAMVVIAEEYLRTKEAALRASEAESVRAHEATRAKSDFLAMMSHELRTPLNSIIGFSDVLVDGQFGSLNERQERYIRNVSDSGRHLLRLINDLLDLSRIEAGRLEVARETCLLRPMLAQVISTITPIADRRQVTLHVEGEGKLLPKVLGDTVRLRQVLYNLLSNAIKFSPVAGRVDIRTSLRGERLRVEVADAGVGITAADQARLFTPFTQLNSDDGSSGSGLGLAISKQLMELMGGVIGVESTVGEGSTFFFELQVEASSVAPGPIDIAAGDQLALIVDDEAAARELIELVMKQEGYRTLHAASGEEALLLARQHLPDVITLDVLLPGMDGWDVLRNLRGDPVTAKIVVVMVSVSNDRLTALSLGAMEHLVKPVDRADLIAALTRRSYTTKVKSRPVHVLAVDDDLAHLELVRSALEPVGFAVRTETTGRAGVQAAFEGPVDLLLLDLVLPDISGVEVVAVLRANPRTRELPILLVTAHDLSVSDRARLKGDVEAVLAKGDLGLEGLREQIRRVVGRKR